MKDPSHLQYAKHNGNTLRKWFQCKRNKQNFLVSFFCLLLILYDLLSLLTATLRFFKSLHWMKRHRITAGKHRYSTASLSSCLKSYMCVCWKNSQGKFSVLTHSSLIACSQNALVAFHTIANSCCIRACGICYYVINCSSTGERACKHSADQLLPLRTRSSCSWKFWLREETRRGKRVSRNIQVY